MFKQIICCSVLCLCLSGCLKKKSNLNHQIFEQISEETVRKEISSESLQNQEKASNSEAFFYEKKQFTIDDDFAYYVQQQESRLPDIPISLAMQPLPEFFSKNAINNSSKDIVVGYSAFLSYENAVNFYRQEMECFGWECEKQFITYEALFLFKKPGKTCIISIRPYAYDKHKDLKNIKILFFIKFL